MYKLSDFSKTHDEFSVDTVSFMQLLKSKWDELHAKQNVFRYKIDNLKEKIVNKKYLLQLNPERGTNRRIPEQINNIRQEFDENKFNFTKISSKEILFSLCEDDDQDTHLLVINVSPISRYHSLLCPSVNKKLPQVVTHESLQLAVNVVLIAQDRNVRIGFNSLCAMASVNHLHYHLFVEKFTLPIESMEWKHFEGPVYCLNENYPVPAFCFEVDQKSSHKMCKEIFKLLQYFLHNSIAHNILITTRCFAKNDGSAQVLIFPRKGTIGVKQLTAFNVAVCELSGWFPVYDEQAFSTLTAEDLELELKKWKLENFDKLCDEIKGLY
ncbi:GDP-D-glucose phosphorylase 1 [Manduca sexta]|uniref:GDP-D-glucose phosphorylase 1 n=1 Tax=Manduca sexta TaxID=7130 RepID=UPI001890AE3D|nr:GDP-D-glucose phosphorylase 1 [Manduca sexta]